MHSIEVHKTIERMMSILYFFEVWQHDNRGFFVSTCFRLWYLLSYGYVVIAIALGSLTTDNENEVVFLAVMAIIAIVIVIRLYSFLWKKDDILRFIREMGTHSIKDGEEFQQVNGSINNFIKFVSSFEIMIFCAVVTVSSVPFFTTEYRLPLTYYFPFDWHQNIFLYICAYVFVIYGLMSTLLYTIFNSIIWYLMMSCGVKYLTLGSEFRNLGIGSGVETIAVPDDANQDQFLVELIGLIKKHKKLDELIDHFKSFFSTVFFIQILTSGLAICGSVYALAFGSLMANPMQYAVYIASLLYNFFDIFMITYLGNEIKFASSKLLYSVFECNWIAQSTASKSCMLVVHEVLKRPQVLVIGKLYALDLEVFSNILNLAYSQFNILKNVQF